MNRFEHRGNIFNLRIRYVREHISVEMNGASLSGRIRKILRDRFNKPHAFI